MEPSRKKICQKLLFSIAILAAFGSPAVMAQQGVVSSGGNATGTNGSASYSVGQVFFTTNSGTSGTVNQGLQQPPINNSELPVTLILFDVTAVNHDHVVIRWETADEVNNDFFSIERSTNGITFDEVTRVKAAGNSQTLRKYSWTDLDPHTGISYYRLKQTDFDHTFTYSAIKSVKINPGLNGIEVYPNPVTDLLNLRIKAGKEEKRSYRILDLNGRIVDEKQLINGQRSIYTNGLPPAFYLIQISSGGDFKEFKIIKN